MVKRTIKRYSLSFKKQVVAEYEAGEAVSHLKQKYGIASAQSIYRWINEHSQTGAKTVREIKDPQSQAEIESLKARISELEKLVTHLSLDKFMLECCVEVAEKKLGYELKKTSATKSSAKPIRKGPTRA